ncbi:hypothetical protein, partial [Xanthomonas oryzae]|uniref:hypothetical protein n=1 Tax=Xanthomonas oryzae TaxID=347 RepID=UPI003CCFE041
LDQIFRLDFGQDLAHFLLALAALDLGTEANTTGIVGTLLNHLIQAGERAAADEQDVLGVDLQEFLLRVLTATLRRRVRRPG